MQVRPGASLKVACPEKSGRPHGSTLHVIFTIAMYKECVVYALFANFLHLSLLTTEQTSNHREI